MKFISMAKIEFEKKKHGLRMTKQELKKLSIARIDFSKELEWQSHFSPKNRHDLPYKAKKSNQNCAFLYLLD